MGWRGGQVLCPSNQQYTCDQFHHSLLRKCHNSSCVALRVWWCNTKLHPSAPTKHYYRSSTSNPLAQGHTLARNSRTGVRAGCGEEGVGRRVWGGAVGERCLFVGSPMMPPSPSHTPPHPPTCPTHRYVQYVWSLDLCQFVCTLPIPGHPLGPTLTAMCSKLPLPHMVTTFTAVDTFSLKRNFIIFSTTTRIFIHSN